MGLQRRLVVMGRCYGNQRRPYFPGEQDARRESIYPELGDSISERSKGDCEITRGSSRKGQCNTCDLISQGWGGGHPRRRRRKTERLCWVPYLDLLCCHWEWGWRGDSREESVKSVNLSSHHSEADAEGKPGPSEKTLSLKRKEGG